jgi:uncharacterized membrane protein YsdA (DUF1294 family)
VTETLRIALFTHGAWLLAWSLVTFVVYAVDKRTARANASERGRSTQRRRVPERTLHLLALIGGFPGAWLGRQRLRHKTRKPGFAAVLALAALVHAALLTTWLVWL